MRFWLRSRGFSLLFAAFATTLPFAASAQEPESPEIAPVEAAPVPEPPGSVESIEVTGERMDTDVQDEAEAVTRFDMADLDKLNISNVDGLAANVPGLHVGQQGQAAIVTLRGIGTENASITGESGVAFHVDGISYARPTAARVSFYDVQLIDVRRGPQGLLGGKNSTSGSIDVTTNDPSQEYELQGDVLFGNYDRVRSRGHVNLPLGELVAVRTAIFYEDRDGYLDNGLVSDSRDPFDVDNFGLRSKLRLTPSDSLDFVLGYNYFKEGGNGPQADLVPVFRSNICGRRAIFPPGYSSVLPRQLACATFQAHDEATGRPIGPEIHTPAIEDADPRETFANRLAKQDDIYWGMHGHLTWDPPEVPVLGTSQLELRGGYQRTDTSFDWDFDSTSVASFPLDTQSLSHEYVGDARWSGSAFSERLDWQTSLFFSRESADALSLTQGLPPVSALGQTFGDDKIRTEQSVENKSYGAAIHGTYHFGDAVSLGLGARWIKDRKRSLLSRIVAGRQEACVGGNFGQTALPDGTYGYPLVPECERTDRGTMWGSKLEWRPIDGHLLYVGIDRGFKSGGFGLGGVGRYEPEKIWAYSAGAKSEFFDQRLQLSLEGFFYNYDDMQIALIDGTQTRTENANARMYGVELQINTEPMEGLRLGALVGYLNTEILDYFSIDPATLDNTFLTDLLSQRALAEQQGLVYANQGTCTNPQTRQSVPCGTLGDQDGLFDYSGNQLSRAPEWKLTLHAEYEIPLGRIGSLTPRVHYSWQDDTYFRAFNRDFDLQEAYHKTDVKLLWESPEDRWSAEVFVENIEDEAVKDYILIGSRVFNSPPLAWYSAPRFYGMRVGFKF